MCSEKQAHGLTRRNFLTGAAAAVAGTAGLTKIAHASEKSKVKEATPLETMNTYGSDLLNMLVLRTYPIAIKMLRDIF
jgi:hypothetical protein